MTSHQLQAPLALSEQPTDAQPSEPCLQPCRVFQETGAMTSTSQCQLDKMPSRQMPASALPVAQHPPAHLQSPVRKGMQASGPDCIKSSQHAESASPHADLQHDHGDRHSDTAAGTAQNGLTAGTQSARTVWQGLQAYAASDDEGPEKPMRDWEGGSMGSLSSNSSDAFLAGLMSRAAGPGLDLSEDDSPRYIYFHQNSTPGHLYATKYAQQRSSGLRQYVAI